MIETPVSLAFPANLSADLLMAHPNWVVYDQVVALAGKVAGPQGYSTRLRATLRNAWRVPAARGLEDQIDLQVAHPEFASVFCRNGGDPLVSSCLVLLHRIAALPSEAEAVDAIARLGSAAAALAAAGEQLQEPTRWRPAERAARLAELEANSVAPVGGEPGALDTADREQARQSRDQGERQAREAEETSRVAAIHLLQQWLQEQQVSCERFETTTYDELQAGERLRQFRTAYGNTPSVATLRKQFALSESVHQQLLVHQRALEHAARERNLARMRWEQSLVGHEDAMQLLFILKAELDEWVALQRLPVAMHKGAHKGSQGRGQILFDPDVLAGVTPEQIASWRSIDLQTLPPQERSARARSVAKIRARQGLAAAVEAASATHQCEITVGADDTLLLVKQAEVALNVGLPQGGQTWSAVVRLEASLPAPKNPGELGNLNARVGVELAPERLTALAHELSNVLTDLVAEYAGALSSSQQEELVSALKARLAAGLRPQELGGELKNTLLGAVGALLRRIEEERAQDLVRLKDYPQAFPLARGLRRRVHFRLGPTNSGKTHDALEALKKAASGVYLAPLRLLAMEVRDRLVAQGVPCNLLTGEEHDLMEGARHTACTVEMMNPEREVEVAIIDEIQMLQDANRGWAWTSALVGTPARDVYLCGADTVHAACVQVLDAIGERHDTKYLERKTPLVIEDQPVGSRRGRPLPESGLQPGDAVIAFSRKDVLTLSARYRAQGFSVATIYGALAPEVRRTESERFASGQADIVVATDAIGMGLNLPVRRVIFSTVHKFDGTQTRPLNAAEIQQIAGRAGRFGMHGEGRVTTLDREDLPHVRRVFAESQPTMRSALTIAPSAWHVEALSQLLGTRQIAPILSYFATRIASRSSLFETAALEDQVGLARVVDRLAGNLDLADKFTFSCAPITHDKDNELGYFESCLHAFVKKRRLHLPRRAAWLDERMPGFLEEAEFLSKDVSLYAWLSYKFPEVYCDAESVPELRSHLSRYIERELLRQGGFGKTSKEAFKSRQR